METTVLIFKTFLFVHIMCGSSALFTGLMALLLKKKRGLHSKFGFVFHCSMMLVAASSFIMSVMHSNYFLFVIGVFSLYLSFAGYRSIRFMKGLAKPGNIDKTIMALSGLLLFGVTYQFLRTTVFDLTGFSSVILVFDLVFIRILINDLKMFNKSENPTKNYWLIRHITRMIPAFTATVTAFLVVNVNYQYPVVIWLAPTVLFLPIILMNVKKYKKKIV
ncbi:hypothetical protein I5M32_15445 [Pedobacter sp. SD-b]|uniref:DUF2306 domain-containing protein n=1 Tax=Pedobacter segetis TaxID=2793069 RepID=A0ABS1BNB8_9SPHI|nr:hypothetical protein [Pedobacter segetis]MBK0384361.1 hypothetical protein [Pedobacter segetis]